MRAVTDRQTAQAFGESGAVYKRRVVTCKTRCLQGISTELTMVYAAFITQPVPPIPAVRTLPQSARRHIATSPLHKFHLTRTQAPGSSMHIKWHFTQMVRVQQEPYSLTGQSKGDTLSTCMHMHADKHIYQATNMLHVRGSHRVVCVDSKSLRCGRPQSRLDPFNTHSSSVVVW